LNLYRDVLAVQQGIAEGLLSGADAKHDPERLVLEDLHVDDVLPSFPRLLEVLEKRAPAKLAEEARRLRASTKEQRAFVQATHFRRTRYQIAPRHEIPARLA
jgi:hypothetical protein